MKKYLVDFKWVEIAPNKVKLIDVKTGAYNLTYKQMLSAGGSVLFKGQVQVETDNPVKVFMAARYKATQVLNNTLAGGSITQDFSKQLFFVATNITEIKVASKMNAVGDVEDKKDTPKKSYKNVIIGGIVLVAVIGLYLKYKK